MSWLDDDDDDDEEDVEEAHSLMGLLRRLSHSEASEDEMNVHENEVGILAIAFGDEQLDDELMLLVVSMPLSVDSMERCVNEWGRCLFILMNCLALKATTRHEKHRLLASSSPKIFETLTSFELHNTDSKREKESKKKQQ